MQGASSRGDDSTTKRGAVFALLATLASMAAVYVAILALKLPDISYEIEPVKVFDSNNSSGLTIYHKQAKVTGDVYIATFRIWNSGFFGIPNTEIGNGILKIYAPEENLRIVDQEITKSVPAQRLNDSCRPDSDHANTSACANNEWFSITRPSESELQIKFSTFNAGAAIELSIIYTGRDKSRELRMNDKGIFTNVKTLNKVTQKVEKSYFALLRNIFISVGVLITISGPLLLVNSQPAPEADPTIAKRKRVQASLICVSGIVIILVTIFAWEIFRSYLQPPF